MTKTVTVPMPIIKFGWIGFLGVAFVLLKLNPGGYADSDVENWPWWLVTLPFWISWAFWLAFIVGGAVLGLIGVAVVSIIDAIDAHNGRKRRAKRIAANREKRKNKGITNF